MRVSSPCTSLCVGAWLATAGLAQVPTGFLIVAEDGNNTSPGLRYVDPSGVVTPIRPVPGTTLALPRAASVTIDAQNPDHIPFVGGLSASIAPVFHRAQVQGSQHIRTHNSQVQGSSGLASRLQWTTFGMLLAIPGGQTPGLWIVPTTGGQGTNLLPLARAYEVTASGSAAAVTTYSAGQPSTIAAVDLNTGQARTLGSAYPALRALLANPSGALVAGTDAGDLLLIDTTTGNSTSLGNPGFGPIVALAGDFGIGMYVLNDRSEVYPWPGGGAPVYRGSVRANDLAWGEVDLPSFLIHGTPCGATGRVPGHFQYVNEPGLGNQTFTLALTGGLANAPAVLVIGTSRTTFLGAPLPLDLSFLDMPGCWLYTDLFATLSLLLDAGGGASVIVPISPAQIFRGTRFDAQWFHLDPFANGRGLAASDGGEAIIR